MEPLLRREHARAACRAPAELEGGLDGLGARIREENVRESWRRAPEQLLGKEARQQRDAELHGAGSLELERLDERGADTRVVAPGIEHSEAAEQIEVTAPVAVVEVLALRPRPHPIETDRAQYAHELRVDRPRVEVVVLARARFEELADHGVSLA